MIQQGENMRWTRDLIRGTSLLLTLFLAGCNLFDAIGPNPCTDLPGLYDVEGVVIASLSRMPITGADIVVSTDGRGALECFGAQTPIPELRLTTDDQGRFQAPATYPADTYVTVTVSAAGCENEQSQGDFSMFAGDGLRVFLFCATQDTATAEASASS